MNIEKMASDVERTHRARLDPHDPILMVGTIAEAVGKETLVAMAKVVTDMADQISTAAVLAENNARAQSNRIVTEGAQYCSGQIKAAGDRVLAELKDVLDQVTAVKQETRSMMRASWGAAAVSVLAVMGLISWQVWGPQ